MATSSPSGLLSDLCADAFAFGLQLKQAKDPGTAESLRQRITGMLGKLSDGAAGRGIAADDLDAARYALVAFFDEIVLGSHWDAREHWASRPLQLELFGSFNAGEQFYERLAALRGRTEAGKIDALEVYAQCLGLGFKGKMADLASQSQRKSLMQDLGREINAARGANGSELSPHWRRANALPEQVRRMPVWVVAAAGAALLLALYLLLNGMLNSQVDTYLQAEFGGEGG